jgi:zinc protease
LRVLPPLVYGTNNAYGIPLTGSGTTKAVEHLSRAAVETFYHTWLKPNNATVIIVGDTMNLREDKHWSYGAHSSIVPARGQRLFLVSAPVQTDKTKESVAELQHELGDLVGSHPITPNELAKAQKDETLKLAGARETLDHVARSVAEMVTFGLPSDYFARYPAKVIDLTVAAVEAAARAVVRPKQLVWVVIGDRAKIEPSLRDLGLCDIRELNEHGQPVAARAQ